MNCSRNGTWHVTGTQSSVSVTRSGNLLDILAENVKTRERCRQGAAPSFGQRASKLAGSPCHIAIHAQFLNRGTPGKLDVKGSESGLGWQHRDTLQAVSFLCVSLGWNP